MSFPVASLISAFWYFPIHDNARGLKSQSPLNSVSPNLSDIGTRPAANFPPVTGVVKLSIACLIATAGSPPCSYLALLVLDCICPIFNCICILTSLFTLTSHVGLQRSLAAATPESTSSSWLIEQKFILTCPCHVLSTAIAA